MGTAVWHYVCPSHPTSGPTPWLECLHVSLYVFMSTSLPMSASLPLHHYMEMSTVHPSHPDSSPTPW